MTLLILSAFASAIHGTPDEIVYLPEGEHKINATVNGKVPADKGEMIAAALQKALEERHKQNEALP